MPNSVCLYGPAFSLQGATRFIGQDVNFQVTFDDQSAADSVLSTEWYLDDLLVTDQSLINFAAKLSCGNHIIGARILTQYGWSGIKGLSFKTCMVPLSLYISGINGLNEGSTAYYYVLQSYTDGTTDNVTDQYTFISSEGGTFEANLFTAVVDDNNYGSPTVTITAIKNGVVAATKDVVVYNTTPIVVTSVDLVGPDSIAEGSSADYRVIANYSNQTQADVTSDYVLSATEGSIVGRTLSLPVNNISGDTRTITLTATKNGIAGITKEVTVVDQTIRAGVLVVDFYNNPDLDVIGFIENTEVAVSHIAAYTGNNFVSAGSAAKDAYILASDFNVSSAANWRFEFNLAKLVADYPATQSFSLTIKGRTSTKNTFGGSYSVMSNRAEMVMQNSQGSYMPSVIGGNTLVPLKEFSTAIPDGANDSYAENDLTTIVSFVYDVLTDTISYIGRDQPIEVSDFDHMAVRYHWLEGAGNDLDIMVGYENNTTALDNLYVGYNHQKTIPANMANTDAYLWWGNDSQSSSGYESVMIGVRKFIQDFPNSPNIVEVGLYAVWFRTPGSGDFTVELVTYKGGVMSVEGTNFINTGGVQVSSNVVEVNTKISNTLFQPSSSYKVGVLRYNKSTDSAVIVINSGL